jgi:5'-nucleotidase
MRPFRFAVLLLAICVAAPDAQAPERRYRILITNDDGVRAPGILALERALQALGDVTIVAPADNQSAKGHSLSITDPIYADAVTLDGDLPATALAATPASCVKVALKALLTEKPDLVVSGINRGVNNGMIAYVSGTVGAAREAALQGIPAIASSLHLAGHPNYGPAAHYTLKVAEMVKARGLDPGVFLNVNVPSGPMEAIKGIRITKQSAQTGTERFEAQTTPSGRRYFWNVYAEPSGGSGDEDVGALDEGYVAVTPMRVGEFDEDAYDDWK